MKVYMDTIGCRLNQAEIEKYAAQFAANGNELVSEMEDADLIVINTCAVTSEAASDSRQKIRQAGRVGNSQIIATGCLATIDPNQIIQLPRVSLNVLNLEKDELVRLTAAHLGLNYSENTGSREAVPGSRKRTRAFIKAQDGCDNHCTFCITRIARGRSKSIPVEEIINEIQDASKSGVKEAVLTGVQLGGWGKDLKPANGLGNLVHTILQKTEIQRLRLSSVEPWDLDDCFFEIWKDPRVCRQLHMPLQSGSPAVLKRMGRKNTVETYIDYISGVRKVSPDIAITTDVLVGFPGESEREFEETLELIEKVNFAGGHVFTYSSRPGTPAALLAGQIASEVKKRRSKIARALFDEMKLTYEKRFIGTTGSVLWESSEFKEGFWKVSGWTDNYMKCNMLSEKNLENQIQSVVLEELTTNGFNVKEKL